MAIQYKIHPSIGVMRVGNSDEYYLAPESVGGLPLDSNGNPTDQFRDSASQVKKQAARFKIFAYDDQNPGHAEEVTIGGNVTHIEWSVHVANKKAIWYEFKQLTGSGQAVPGPHESGTYGYQDRGYQENNRLFEDHFPDETTPNMIPRNPLRNEDIPEAERLALILDPGIKHVGGPGQSTQASFDLPQTSPARNAQPFGITNLGGMETTSEGYLVVHGGSGNSGYVKLKPNYPDQPSINQYANNKGWFDDISDGPVTATIYFSDNTQVAVQVPAWVTCAPPKYAPQIVNQVTMWDNMYDLFVREANFRPDIYADGVFNENYQVDVQQEILPILSRPDLYQWVTDMPPNAINKHRGIKGDAADDQVAEFPFTLLRGPEGVNQSGLMPLLCGDNPFGQFSRSRYLSLTRTQHFLLTQWGNGKVAHGGRVDPLGPGEQLDRAYLENCVGGPFTPGIEITWISRNANIYAAPFRIKHKPGGNLSLTNGVDNFYGSGLEPGDLSKYMAQPWQSDFNECSNQPVEAIGSNNPVNIWWWPAQRPWYVRTHQNPEEVVAWTRGYFDNADNPPFAGDLQMVTNWKDLGFIVKEGSGRQTRYLERHRIDAAIQQYHDTHGGNVQAEALVFKGKQES